MSTITACTILLAAALLLAPASLHSAQPAPAPARPNIVFILADDLGYGDLGCTGSPDVRTPNIDRLAAQGVRFTQFYSNGPECTPTRTALLTGRYQQRVGGLECAIGVGNVGRYDDAIRLRERRELGLPPSDTTLPRLMQKAGYTTALAGKWHLGYEPKFLPRRHGFDQSFGPLGGAVDYFTHKEPEGEPMLYRNEERVERDGYLTDLITSEAVEIIRRERSRPFFLYAAFTAPHDPYQGPTDRTPSPSRATYQAMVERLDHGIGEILKALETEGLASRTLVVFTSDNGGTRFARNAPFSRGKGTTYEGGIRVPCLVRWPGVLPSGTVSDRVGITMDLTVSLARAAGARLPDGHRFDGIDLLEAERSRQPAAPRALFWRQRRGERTWWGVRDGTLKYVRMKDGEKAEEHLFDLAQDVAEAKDLLPAREGDAERLRARLAAWEVEVRPTR